ncbi:GNAT family N-acetyltransferase [Plantactinospora sp. GCM10030261]|uniref:GNAT family N-acetyltransferase n=1 Tax=Plantactinospora sp. GCM10030261 TaxID=3273420 RepID=UPI00361CF765
MPGVNTVTADIAGQGTDATEARAGAVPSIPDLVTAWGQGWVVSRGAPAPVVVPGGFRVDVGLPGHRSRHVLHSYDAGSLSRLARTLVQPGSWIKISGDRATLRAAFPAAWRMDIPGWLMARPLVAEASMRAATTEVAGTSMPAGMTEVAGATMRAGVIDPPYRLRVDLDGRVIVAMVLDRDGALAASGRLAPAGAYGIVDQVETAVAHRRRGLGSVVMRALAERAAEDGVRTGVLVATDDGRALYERLGWTVRSEVSGAYLPEPDRVS